MDKKAPTTGQDDSDLANLLLPKVGGCGRRGRIDRGVFAAEESRSVRGSSAGASASTGREQRLVETKSEAATRERRLVGAGQGSSGKP